MVLLEIRVSGELTVTDCNWKVTLLKEMCHKHLSFKLYKCEHFIALSSYAVDSTQLKNVVYFQCVYPSISKEEHSI